MTDRGAALADTTAAAATPLQIRRRVVIFGGFHAATPEARFRHFQRQLSRFCATWGASGEASGLRSDGDFPRWTARVCGPDWMCDADVTQFSWDDLIRAERGRTWVSRLPLSLFAFADFVAYGALWGYLRASWRYALFFLYPFAMIALFAAASVWLAGLALGLAGVGDAVVWRCAVAVALFALMTKLLGDRMSLDYILDNWIFAQRSVRAPVAEIDARLDRMVTLLEAGPETELLIVGHSFGPIHAADLIDRLIARRPAGPPIRFAALGSSIMKLAAHGRAERLRAQLGRLAASPRLIWADFTAITDFMNFFKAEPVRSLKLTGNPAIPRAVKFSRMLTRKDYRRLQFNLLAMHNQFIASGERRAPYDFIMLTLGPFPLEVFAQSPPGALEWIGADGALTAAGREAAANKSLDGTSPRIA
jgi:hypothetical protein